MVQSGADLAHVDSRLAGISNIQSLGFQGGDLILSVGLIEGQALTGLVTLIPAIGRMRDIVGFRMNASGRIKGLGAEYGVALEGLEALDSKIPRNAGIGAIRWNDRGEILTVSFVRAGRERKSSCTLETCQALFGSGFVIPEGINVRDVIGVIRCPDETISQAELSRGFYGIGNPLPEGALSNRFLLSTRVSEFIKAGALKTEEFPAKASVESVPNIFRDAVQESIRSLLTKTGKTIF